MAKMNEETKNALLSASRALLTAAPKPEKAERTRKIIRRNPWAGGFKSDALGVSPDQIKEAREELAKQGVSCEFDEKTGAAIIESSRHYRDVAKACGIFTGRDGYQVRDSEGHAIGTGRQRELAKRDLHRSLFG